MADVIARLRGLVERATRTSGPAIFVRRKDKAPDGYCAIAGTANGRICICPVSGINVGDDEKVIVAAVNALPALLAVAEAAKKLVEHTCDFDLETALANLETHT